ncbi:hypothetical protein CVIRNUC_000749 [Coccomyxa viridis]|uniref:protein-tyrosine sulfotransferase n=1 Tax=Coccomyxa viridis TaxID=1274662 RepID=A0AAV1HU16_9CHLO|nr:hypothetical protein CVIRNUC_000749 [Coccomyxa viridis]
MRLAGFIETVVLAFVSLRCMAQEIHQAENVGRLEENAQLTRAALRDNPTDSRLYAQLGTLLHHLDFISPNGGARIPEAEQAYLKAVELSGGEPRVRAGLYGNIGALLMGAAGRMEDALEYTEKSIEAGREINIPDSTLTAGSYFNRGKILGMLGREEDAQEAYKEAALVSEGVAAGSFAKALASLKAYDEDLVAKMEEAVRFLQLERDSTGEPAATGGEADLAESLPSSRRRRQRSRSKAASAGELRERWSWLSEIKPEDKPWIYFALHRGYNAKAEYDKAWEHLVEANRLQRDTYTFNPQEETRIVRGLVQAFPVGAKDESLRNALEGNVGSRDKTPIFVVGLPRSGSTLVEQILASHPSVWGAGEDTEFAPLLPKLFRILQSQSGSPADIGDEYVDKMRQRVPKMRNVTRIVDKMLRNAFNLGYIQLALPRSCVIHTVRHPLDVALSCFSQPFEGRGLPWAAQLDEVANAIKNHHDVMRHWDALLPGRVLHVPYEQLVEDQEGWSRRLLQHCGLPWDDSVLEFHKTERDVQTASLSQVRQKLYKTAIGKWRRYEDKLQPIMTDLHGYIEDYEATLGARKAHDEL